MLKIHVSAWSDISLKVDQASEAVLTERYPNLPYDRFRPLGDGGYRMRPQEVRQTAGLILQKTGRTVPHGEIELPQSYPSASIKLVTDMNTDLAERIGKRTGIR